MSIKYTTVCLDVNGRYYDLSKEHPNWELHKKNRGKEVIYQRRFVVNAFTCTVEEYKKLKRKNKK